MTREQPELTASLHLRVAPADRAHLDRVVARVRGARAAQVAREALRLGLDLLDAAPERLVIPKESA